MKRLPLFPDTINFENDVLTISGQDLTSLADEYETPLYMYDRITMDNGLSRYKRGSSSGSLWKIYTEGIFVSLFANWNSGCIDREDRGL